MANPRKSVIGSDGTGFFVNYCRVLNHIQHCRLNNQIPVVYWNESSSYYDENGYNGSLNAWEYYFEPVSDEKYEITDPIRRDSYAESDGFSTVWDYHQYVDNLCLCSSEDRKNFINITNGQFGNWWTGPNNGKHLYDKEFRSFINRELITPYIKIKANIQEKIELLYSDQLAGKKTIGIHLRGRHLYGILPFVPIEVILETANSLADENTQFFIATDQQPLIDQAKRLLKGKVIFYDMDRFEITTSPYPGVPKLHPKLGEDLLIEAMLLSRCDHLVHTISTVSTAVLYLNPTMSHTLLY